MDEFKKKKSLPVIPLMRIPLDVTLNHSCPLDSVPILDPRLVEILQKMGFSSLFPLEEWQDSCICYAHRASIVEPFDQRPPSSCCRANPCFGSEVKDVFSELGSAVGLSVGLAVGQSSLADEISELMEKPMPEASLCDPEDFSREWRSKVDILVATPGRLMDHVNNTKGFTVEHLCYLVVNEADRLLREAYQSWLPTVVKLAYSSNQCPSPFGSLKTFRTLCVNQKLKPVYLLALLKKLQGEKCIVITSSVEKTHKLCI